jgi:anti-sigma-K factor RskA
MTAVPGDDAYLVAGEYVLGLLDVEAARAIEARIEREVDLRAAVAYWERRLIGLAGAAAPIAPGPALWARIATSVALRVAPANDRAPRRRAPLLARVALWRALAGAGFAAALIALFVAFGVPRPGPAYAVVLQATADRSVGWIGEADRSGRLRFVPLARAEVPPDRALELWARADDPQGPISLGVIPTDRSFTVTAGDAPRLEAGQLFAISLEPAGGSPSGRPTGPVLFAGRAVAAR